MHPKDEECTEQPVGQEPQESTAKRVEHTACCIVGAGPAGAVLAFLLARQGFRVILPLEEGICGHTPWCFSRPACSPSSAGRKTLTCSSRPSQPLDSPSWDTAQGACVAPPLLSVALRKRWAVIHIVAMTGSYIGLWTAFLVDNAHDIPWVKQLPTLSLWFLPGAIGLPFLIYSLLRYTPHRKKSQRQALTQAEEHPERRDHIYESNARSRKSIS